MNTVRNVALKGALLYYKTIISVADESMTLCHMKLMRISQVALDRKLIMRQSKPSEIASLT